MRSLDTLRTYSTFLMPESGMCVLKSMKLNVAAIGPEEGDLMGLSLRDTVDDFFDYNFSPTGWRANGNCVADLGFP